MSLVTNLKLWVSLSLCCVLAVVVILKQTFSLATPSVTG